MHSSSKPHRRATPAAAAVTPPHRWLLLVHQLPSTPSNLRVRTWRRLQQLGAIPVKQAVYVLPDTPGAREDFEWLKTEINDCGGDATVFAADSVDNWTEDALVEEFRRSRQDAYMALAGDVERVLGRLAGKRRRPGTRAPAVTRLLEVFRQRLAAIDEIDFFGSAGRDRVLAVLARLEARASGSSRPSVIGSSGHAAAAYRGRLWVTRPRPGVDRMGSAWLIRRFIDSDARFGFAGDREAVPPDAIPFDMFGVELTHRGGGCTFETLCAVFELADPALERIAAIVHDLDLKDGRFGAAHAPTIGSIIDGLRLAYADDAALLDQGMAMFEAVYVAMQHADRPDGPRVVASKRQPDQSARSRRGGHDRGKARKR